MVIDDVLPGDAPMPMVIGHILSGFTEVDATLEIVGSEPPIHVRVRALENFRRPGEAASGRADVGLLLELADPAHTSALVVGATLQTIVTR